MANITLDMRFRLALIKYSNKYGSSFEKELKAITVQGLNPEEYTVLNSIPGIGKVYSAGILAELDSIKAFKTLIHLPSIVASSGTTTSLVKLKQKIKR